MSRIRDKDDPQGYNSNQDIEGDCPQCANCSGYCEWPCKSWFVWHDKKIRESVMDEFGILHGEDAKRFNEVLEHPEPMNEQTRILMKRALEMAKQNSHDPKHDASIRKDEREKVLDAVCKINIEDNVCKKGKDCKSCAWESLRQQEQSK